LDHSRNITHLNQVSFPVFKLKGQKPLEADGVLYYSNSYLNTDTNEVEEFIKLVDNRKEEGANLNQRRLKMLAQGAPLFPLRMAIYFLGDLIKLSKKGTWFIDSNGNIFTYTKTTSAKLKFYKVKKIVHANSTGLIVEVEGIPDRFKTLFTQNKDLQYAGILEYKGVHIFYGLYDQKYKDTRRMI